MGVGGGWCDGAARGRGRLDLLLNNKVTVTELQYNSYRVTVTECCYRVVQAGAAVL